MPRQARAAVAIALALGAVAIGASAASAAPALTWSSPAPIGAGLTSVACPSFALCVTVDSSGTAAVRASANSWSAFVSTGKSELNSIACPSTTLCVAVGNGGAITVSGSGGSTWTPTTVADTNNLTSVSCASTAFCLAVDADGNAEYSNTPASPTAWTEVTAIDATTHLGSVSCPSSSFCAAVDANRQLLVSTNPTVGGWSVVWTNSAALTSIACSNPSLCVALDTAGHVIASGDASSTPSTWSSTGVDSASTALNSVACTPEGFCAAGDGAGAVLESDNPASAPPTWSAATPDPGHSITGVSCTDGGLCAAVDGSGNALTGTLPPPSVVTGTATADSQTVATLTGTVNPNDALLTSCSFNYGPTTAYGASVPCSSVPSPDGGAQSVSANIAGLSASSTYYFQVVASSDTGSSAGTSGSVTTPAPVKPTPTISGTPAVGNTLTCNLGVAAPAGAVLTYAWVRDSTTIATATAATYPVTVADETHHLYCRATIAGDGGSASAISAYVAVPAETIGTVSETAVSKASAAGHSVTTKVSCSPQASSGCTITLRLTRRSSGHLITLGSSTTRIAAGATTKVAVTLNSTGRRLLADTKRLVTTLTVSGTVIGVISATLHTQLISLTKPASHARLHRG